MDFANYWFSSAAGGGGYQIGNSLRFRGSQFLSRTLASSVSTAWSMSAWVKIAKTDTSGYILTTGQRGLEHSTQKLRDGQSTLSGPGLHRDPSAWYHCLLTATSTGTNETLYVNGVQQFSGVGWAALSGAIAVGTAAWSTSTSPFNGYLAEVHFVDGQVLDATDFGEYNNDGVWVPIDYAGTHGSNGFYLDFSDPSNIGADRSGNGNDFTPTGFELSNTTSTNYDWMEDSPTNNHSTLSPISGDHWGLQKANLTTEQVGTEYRNAIATHSIPPGTSKIYFEARVATATGVNNGLNFGLAGKADFNANGVPHPSAYVRMADTAGIRVNGSTVGSISTASSNDILQCAYDPSSGKVWFGSNNSWYLSGNPSAGTNPAGTLAPATLTPWGNNYADALEFNFGQRPFTYAPPTGFEPLSTAELEAVAITNPSDHFQTILSDSPPIIPAPAAPGDAYGGGFYAGQIRDGNKVYNLIVAPLESGSLQGQYGGATAATILYKVNNDLDPDVFGNEVNGSIPTLAGANSTYPMFNWTVNSATGPNAGTYDATNAVGTGIGGFNDWYMPAKNEYEILYRNLKPTTDANIITGSGVNPNAVPPTNDYTTTDPAQTTAALFQSGGGQDFVTGLQYWTATTGIGYRSAYFRSFLDGWSAGTSQNNPLYARAIRREFAYDAGILDYAQAAFPNGLWWIKDRANSNDHQMMDSVRTAAKGSNMTSFQPTTGSVRAYVAPTGNSVAWCWSAPELFTPTGGTISYTGTARRNLEAGFSIVRYNPNGVNGATIAHGLNTAPEFILFLPDNETGSGNPNGDHVCYHVGMGVNKYMGFARDYGEQTAPILVSGVSNTVVTVSDSTNVNGGAEPLQMYSWHSVPGYSSFGRYQGTSGTDGSFIYTGFRVGWLMIKRISTGSSSWYIFDNQRDTYNPVEHYLRANLQDPEETSQNLPIDFLSNGFKCRTSSGYIDDAGDSYVYIAFAEHCFGGANVSPSPAR